MRHEAVIGLEIHVQLATSTRLFSACPRAADTHAPVNTCVDPVTLGLPGTLPSLNARAVELALRLGLAFGSEIARRSEFDRKHYFYPDLPRNYQITQERCPILLGGKVPYEVLGEVHELALIRCHLEEDAARSVHREGRTRVDFNRAGVGLLEIVTEPALREPGHASAVVHSVREMARWLSINDGSLEEGQIRCDANVSLRGPDGSAGARVELKNLNSVRGIGQAIETELRRQRRVVAEGATVRAQTRGWDAGRGASFAQRGKESTVDYRFLPEPDLGPLQVGPELVECARGAVGELPLQVRARWRGAGMDSGAARVLGAERKTAEWVDALLERGAPAGELGKWCTGELLRRARERGCALEGLPWDLADLARLVGQVARGERSDGQARALLDTRSAEELGRALDEPGPAAGSAGDVGELVDLLARHPRQVALYRSGKEGLLGWFVAEARRSVPGFDDPARLAGILRRLLSRDAP